MSRIRSLVARIEALEQVVDGQALGDAARALLAGREPQCNAATRALAERLAADLREIDRLDGRLPAEPYEHPNTIEEPQTRNYE